MIHAIWSEEQNGHSLFLKNEKYELGIFIALSCQAEHLLRQRPDLVQVCLLLLT